MKYILENDDKFIQSKCFILFIIIMNKYNSIYNQLLLINKVSRAVARILLLGGQNGSLRGQVLKTIKF